jgi:hypothetical protein
VVIVADSSILKVHFGCLTKSSHRLRSNALERKTVRKREPPRIKRCSVSQNERRPKKAERPQRCRIQKRQGPTQPQADLKGNGKPTDKQREEARQQGKSQMVNISGHRKADESSQTNGT